MNMIDRQNRLAEQIGYFACPVGSGLIEMT